MRTCERLCIFTARLEVPTSTKSVLTSLTKKKFTTMQLSSVLLSAEGSALLYTRHSTVRYDRPQQRRMIHQTKTPPAGAHCTHNEGPQRIGDASPARLAKRHTGIGTPHTHTQLAIQAQPHRHRSGGGFRKEHVRENPSARLANKERRSQSSSTLNPPAQRRVTLAGQTSVTRARIQQRQFRTG